ncbi:DUF2634 domain-containing protein [Anaerocolumna xylanovorans]|uniref:DUF2634 domain-containing protein n=1 Tax=Anaerocolumna xylanovorans DSM 12503 TaxID=1121345 RepID=A0A1M7Y6K5_9FIRM|nr:DUF2634 domain-containing protein [Anaerocolumna xylanovorans]SHO48148.1 Protein of unknown function [Anaerocolumna xylanovorans DSM 12503]
MIPANLLEDDLIIETEVQSSRTYGLYPDKIQGYITDADAVWQAVYKMLNTEKYEYPIYSFDYGIALEDLIGKDPDYVVIEIERRISECLLSDERISDVTDFEFEENGDELHISFLVKSIYGDLNVTKEVTY